MERISQEARLLCSMDIKTTKELSLYMNTLQKEISSLEEKRDKLYYQNTKLKKEEKQGNYNELSLIAGKIQYLKREVKMCREIEERVPKIKENIKELNAEKGIQKGKEDIDGFEVVARLTGIMAKEMAVMLVALSKSKGNKVKGQIGINSMLKRTGDFRVFTIKKEDYKEFKKHAKRYGILYSAMCKRSDLKSKDGVIDLLVKGEDAVRVNRMVERFNLTTTGETKLETALDKEDLQKIVADKDKTEISKDIQEKNTSEDLLNKLLKKQNIKEENENTNPSNIPNTEKEIQSENLLKTNEKMEGTKKEEKPSIREKIDTIKKEQEEKEKQKTQEESKEIPKKEKVQETKHTQPKKKNRKKERSK